MKHLRYLLMAALVAMPLTACDEDDDTPQDIVEPTPVGTVSGTVSVEGNGLSGVSVTLVGQTSQSATTGSGGSFSFTDVEAGSYGVSISDIPSSVSFSTTSKTTSITTDGQTVTVDFSGSYIRTSTIAGQVVVAGAGISGIAVTATGPEGTKNAVTDNGGNFSFSGLRAGEYTVAISGVPADYNFATTSYAVTLGTGEAKTASFFGTEVVTVDPVTASVVIKSVTTGATNVPVVPSAVAGQIDVTLQVDPGENDLSKIALLLNGTEVASQTLSQAVASEMEKADGIFEIVFSVNTAEFNGNTFVPTYPNGQYALSAQLGLENAQQASVSTSIDLVFNNLDTFRATAVPTQSMIGGTTSSNAGALYYGGGPIVVNVNPIVYSGRTIASVTTGFTNTGGAVLPGADNAAPFAITYNLTGYASAAAVGTGNEAFTVVAATYTDGTAFGPLNGGATLPLTVSNGSNFFVDNAAPVAGTLALTNQVTADQLCCSNNWVNSGYTVSTGYTAGTDNAVGVFIGGVTRNFFAGNATAANTTIDDGTPITTIGDAGLAATLVSTTYTLVHREADAFGNLNAPTRMIASADNPGTTFGIDDTAPNTQTWAGQADFLINPAVAGVYSFAGTEDKSGFSTDYVRAKEALFNTAGTNYPNYGVAAGANKGNMLNYPNPLAAPSAASTEGYYTFEGYIINQAGGAFSPSVVRHTLIDVTAPVAQNVQIPGSLVGGAMTVFTAPVTDNLDLVTGDFDFEFSTAVATPIVYPGAPTTAFWPFGDPGSSERVLGTAWDDVLTTSATAQRTVPFVESVETTAAGVPTGTVFGASFVRIGAIDAAGNKSVAQVNNFASGTVDFTNLVGGVVTPEFDYSTTPMTGFNIATTPAVAGATNLCNGTGAACAAGNTKSVTVTVTITGPAGTYAPPFAGGYIYLFVNDDATDATFNTPDDNNYLIAWAPGGTGVVTDTGAVRTYTYTFTINSADVSGIAAGTAINILAIGVNSTGNALLGPLDGTFTVVTGS